MLLASTHTQVQREYKKERESLVKGALRSLHQLRSHLTETLTGLRIREPVSSNTHDGEGFGTYRAKDRWGGLSKYRWGVVADSGEYETIVVRVESGPSPVKVRGRFRSARNPFGPHPVHTSAPSIAQPVAGGVASAVEAVHEIEQRRLNEAESAEQTDKELLARLMATLSSSQSAPSLRGPPSLNRGGKREIRRINGRPPPPPPRQPLMPNPQHQIPNPQPHHTPNGVAASADSPPLAPTGQQRSGSVSSPSRALDSEQHASTSASLPPRAVDSPQRSPTRLATVSTPSARSSTSAGAIILPPLPPCAKAAGAEDFGKYSAVGFK